MTHWMSRLVAGTRGRILSLLRSEPSTVSALSAQVQVSSNAVRAHLTSLQRDGLVEEGGTVHEGGVGKPAQLYRATIEAEELFPKAYAAVLNELLRTMAEREGEDAVVSLLQEVGRRAAGGDATGPLERRVEAAEKALRGLGADVKVEREAAEAWRLEGQGCPLSAVVREQTIACTLVQSLIAEVSGGEVTICCRHGDRPRCSFRVEPAAEA